MPSEEQWPIKKVFIGFFIGCLFYCLSLCGQTTAVGEIARDFTLTNHTTGLPLRLSDYAGEIVLLDFFTYWCPFCQQSSPVIEQQIQQYYDDQKGNTDGLPVRVIGINLEIQNPAGTDRFIQQSGMTLVADDFDRVAFNQFVFPEERVATLFVIINGVANANFSQWEVLYRTNSYEGIPPFRSVIDSIQKVPATSAPPLISNWHYFSGTVTFDLQGMPTQKYTIQSSTNLVDWVVTASISSSTNGLARFRDAPGCLMRFYRAIVP